MENFKEIADKCLSGELSGTFVLRNGKIFYSKTHLSMTSLYVLPYCIAGWCYSVVGNCYSKSLSIRDNDVIDFIPDNMQKKIEIDIPEGKVPVMEQTDNGVVITWEEKEITYADVISKLVLNQNAIYEFWSDKIHKGESSTFYKKVEALRKLTNIRNYFGKPTDGKGYGIFYHEYYKKFYADVLGPFSPVHVCFSTKKQAEQAIKMLGDELKYLFEPW